MSKSTTKLNINSAADQLRSIVWNSAEGELLGSEVELTEMLGVSRPTVRQVARLLEQEGLLKVKRGINGGYFSSRPSVEVIENSVGAYLKMLDVDSEDITEIASLMWTMVVKKAAKIDSKEIADAMADIRARVLSLNETALFDDVLAIEEDCRRFLFKLIKSPYIELIFHINRSFSQENFPRLPGELDGTEEHQLFLRQWQKVKMLEIDAIIDGDVDTAELASRRNRNLYHQRLWGHERD